MQAPFLVHNILKNPSPKKALTDMTEDQNGKVPKLLLKWGSGGPRARFFKDNEVKAFFSNLFRQVIRLGKQEQLSLSLNTTDLFHGHLVLLNEGTPDLIIIFHAQEYPHDLPFTQYKSREAVRTYKKTLKGKKFGHKTISFQRRNFIWSLNQSKLFNLNTKGKSPLFPLIFPKGWYEDKELRKLAILGNAVQDNRLGKSLGSLNFFPSQNIPLYWSP